MSEIDSESIFNNLMKVMSRPKNRSNFIDDLRCLIYLIESAIIKELFSLIQSIIRTDSISDSYQLNPGSMNATLKSNKLEVVKLFRLSVLSSSVSLPYGSFVVGNLCISCSSPRPATFLGPSFFGSLTTRRHLKSPFS